MASTALDRLRSESNLRDVWKEYRPRAKNSASGVDWITSDQFDKDLTQNVRLLRELLQQGYRYSPLRGIDVPKKDPTKFRIICVPTIRDRVVQRAVLRTIETKATKLGIVNDVSFGFVKDTAENKRGTAAARNAAIKHRQEKPWAFKADISAFFDQIPRDQLINEFQKAFSLKSLLPLVTGVIRCEIDATNPRLRRILNENGIKEGRGLRQGMPLSPVLSNFLLRNFDKAFITHRYNMIRYADDLLVLASSGQECEAIQEITITELDKLKLTISPTKTEICEPDQPVEFLGMELGLRPGTSTYGLTISTKQTAKVKEEFTKYHDIEFCLSNRLNIATLLHRLQNMQAGYKIAYGVADNRDAFYDLLGQWTTNCATKLYSSIFSPSAISRLTLSQRRFLMLGS